MKMIGNKRFSALAILLITISAAFGVAALAVAFAESTTPRPVTTTALGVGATSTLLPDFARVESLLTDRLAAAGAKVKEVSVDSARAQAKVVFDGADGGEASAHWGWVLAARELSLLKQSGVNIQDLTVVVLDGAGQPLFAAREPIDAMSPPGAATSNASLEGELEGVLRAAAQAEGVVLVQFSLTDDQAMGRTATAVYAVKSGPTRDDQITRVMEKVNVALWSLGDKTDSIVVYRTVIQDADTAAPLLDLVYDYKTGRTTAWHAKGFPWKGSPTDPAAND